MIGRLRKGTAIERFEAVQKKRRSGTGRVAETQRLAAPAKKERWRQGALQRADGVGNGAVVVGAGAIDLRRTAKVVAW